MRHAVVGLIFLICFPLAVWAQNPDQSWQITINVGPCELFSRGTFRSLYSGPVGSYLVGGMDGETQCTGQGTDSTLAVGSGMAFAVVNQKDNELIITVDDPAGFMKLIAKGATPMGRRSGTAYLCLYPETASWEVWEQSGTITDERANYQALSAQGRADAIARVAWLNMSTALKCLKGMFSLLPG